MKPSYTLKGITLLTYVGGWLLLGYAIARNHSPSPAFILLTVSLVLTLSYEIKVRKFWRRKSNDNH